MINARRPASFVAIDRSHDVGHVLGRALQPRAGGVAHEWIEATIGQQGRQSDGENGDADEGDREPRSQSQPPEHCYSFANR